MHGGVDPKGPECVAWFKACKASLVGEPAVQSKSFQEFVGGGGKKILLKITGNENAAYSYLWVLASTAQIIYNKQ